MSVSCQCLHASRCHTRPRRRMTLPGSREEALEFLPAFCADERLELDGGRISLVCESTRVDVRIVAERGPDTPSGDVAPQISLELAFVGRSEAEADAFIASYRRRARVRQT